MDMKNILYKITYIPHLGTPWPKYYIGSKYKYKGNYYGSPSSKQIFDFTDGLPLGVWWKREQEENIQNFDFEILETFPDGITAQELVIKEKELQTKLNVLSEDYFNQSIATIGYCSVKNTEYTKNKKSIKTKEYWDSDKGEQKKIRLIDRNKKISSVKMLERWQNPTEKMKNRKCYGRTKGSKDLKKRERTSHRILADGVIFENAIEAAKHFDISPVNIRRKCRMELYNDWRYLDNESGNNN